MKLAAAQTNIRLEQPKENLQIGAAQIASAAQAGCDAVLFPEMSFTGFSMRPMEMAQYAEETHAEMRRLAKYHGISIGYGWISLEADGFGQNHYRLIHTSGETVLDYVKLHPFSAGQEQLFYRGGSKICTGSFCGIPTSVQICYDLRFPESFRLAARHTSLVIVPANWLEKRSAHWKILLRARAIENQVYVLGINCVGTQGQNRFLGGSCLINPEGEILLELGEGESLGFAQIEDDVAPYRDAFPAYYDARFSLYDALRRAQR